MICLKKYLPLFIFAIYALSCSKQEFTANKSKDSSSISPVEQYKNNLCSSSTLIKPPVDFLFLWDNTGSQNLIVPELKKALYNTVNLISSRFDYHILLAPLIATSNEDMGQAMLVSSTPKDIDPNTLQTYGKSFDQAVANLPYPATTVNEKGLDRAIALLKNNQANGIFRKNAYTIVVIMSNGDDYSFNPPGDQVSPVLREAFIKAKKEELIKIRNEQLKSLMFRFMSMVPQSYCPAVIGKNGEANTVYKEISKLLYETPYTNGMPTPDDQNGRSTSDSYDICTANDFTHIFDGINGAIQDVVIKHRYDYWPVVDASIKTINSSDIRVRKNTGVELSENDPNGFTWVGGPITQNTRYEPTPGEPYTGYLIKLNGTGRIQYPECLIIETTSAIEYYGYIQLTSTPMAGTIKVEINGKAIPESATNGWQAIGYVTSQNIKIKSPTDLSPSTPEVLKSGYFLKLYGDAVYSNGATVKVIYDPQANLH